MKSRIDDFRGPYRWLSNVHVCDVELDEVMYDSVEYAFQAAKSLDEKERELIRTAPSWQRAKRMAGPRGVISLRPDWEEVGEDGLRGKDRVMLHLLVDKYTRHPHLGARLVRTGKALLIEGNTWHDNWWGDCHCAKCSRIPGKNMLGRLTMQVREALAQP